MKWSLLLLIFISFTALAKDAPSCEAEMAVGKVIARAPLTVTHALEIIGDGEIGQGHLQLHKALNFLMGQNYVSYEQKVEDTRTLLKAISTAQYFTWSAQQFYGPDKTVGFAGDTGYFIWLSRDGKIFKGIFRHERDLNEYDEWSGNSDSLSEVKP